jgi:polyhydroxyalkanoate synthesis regulator phasin
MSDVDIKKKDETPVEPTEGTTEASEDQVNNESMVVEDSPPIEVFEKEDVDADFPITYEVSASIADHTNPNSLVYFEVHLFGANNEDLGVQSFVQDLRAIDQSLDEVGDVLGQRAAQQFYASENYQKLLKIAPKRKDAARADAANFQPLMEKFDAQTEQLVAKQESFAASLQEQQANAEVARQNDLAELQQKLDALNRMVTEVQATQGSIIEWLGNFYNLFAPSS